MEIQTRHIISKRRTFQNQLIITNIYRKVYPIIGSYISKSGGTMEDTDDIVQEGILQLMEKLENKSFGIHTSVYGYLLGICKNLWKTELRNKQKQDTTAILFNYQDIATNKFLDCLIQEDQYCLFKKHYKKLSNSTQNIWKLSFEGKSTKEIAIQTGYTEGYVRKKKCESKKVLIQFIRKDPAYLECAV